MQYFQAGDTVVLNEEWPAYNYLLREFGSMFPRQVQKVDGDVVSLHGIKDPNSGKTQNKSICFAAQVLRKGARKKEEVKSTEFFERRKEALEINQFFAEYASGNVNIFGLCKVQTK